MLMKINYANINEELVSYKCFSDLSFYMFHMTSMIQWSFQFQDACFNQISTNKTKTKYIG